MKRFFIALLLLWVAAGCQQTVAPRVALAGASPDFLLIVVGCMALFGSRMSGAFLGFGAGLLQGALVGANLGPYAVSRTISGFMAGWFTALEFEANAAVAFFSVAISTILGQLLLMFGAPPSHIPSFLLATIGSAMYNGVLAMPLFVLLKRVIDPASK